MPGWKAVPPKDDHGYLDLMSRAIFSAGLNWRMVEKKWPHFRKAFRDFSPERVARLSEREIRALMQDPGIVRNERKIRATVENAKAILDLAKEHGSVKGYIEGFGNRQGVPLVGRISPQSHGGGEAVDEGPSGAPLAKNRACDRVVLE